MKLNMYVTLNPSLDTLLDSKVSVHNRISSRIDKISLDEFVLNSMKKSDVISRKSLTSSCLIRSIFDVKDKMRKNALVKMGLEATSDKRIGNLTSRRKCNWTSTKDCETAHNDINDL